MMPMMAVGIGLTLWLAVACGGGAGGGAGGMGGAGVGGGGDAACQKLVESFETNPSQGGADLVREHCGMGN